MCYYLKIKIRANYLGINNLDKLYYRKLMKYIQTFHSIQMEIHEYNHYFWSKYLFILWLFPGSFCLFLLYVFIYKTINLFYKIIIIYFLFIMISYFIFQILTASSVNSGAKRDYKVLNSKMASNKRLFTRITNQLKVFKIILFII